MSDHLIAKFKNFRDNLYDLFPARRDAIINLVDSVAGNTTAKSPVELSLNSPFLRTYNSIYDAIENVFKASSPGKAQQERSHHQQRIVELVSKTLPLLNKRGFQSFVIDQTTIKNAFSETMKDRGYVYSPNPVADNKPIVVGHSYSCLAALPEKMGDRTPPWVVPLNIQRVPTNKTGNEIALQQVEMLMKESLPFHEELCVLVVDSAYSVVKFLCPVVQNKNIIVIARLSGSRVLFRQYISSDSPKGPGHPKWYGERFDLQDPCTWGKPDETSCTIKITKNGTEWFVMISSWNNMLMTGKIGLPMHQHPFTLIRIVIQDRDGNKIYQKPMWLTVAGDRRSEISLIDVQKAYGQRFDVEHFFRFGKNRLLMISYQTPEVEHEENWLELVGLACVQLWLASPLANTIPRPWERYAITEKTAIPSAIVVQSDATVLTEDVVQTDEAIPTDIATQTQTDIALATSIAIPTNPSSTQRDFERIIRLIGTPAKPLKRRGNSPGRPKGWSPGRRERCPVVKKGGTPLPRGPP